MILDISHVVVAGLVLSFIRSMSRLNSARTLEKSAPSLKKAVGAAKEPAARKRAIGAKCMVDIDLVKV